MNGFFFFLQSAKSAGSSSVALHYNEQVVAILRDPEFYYQRKEERCSRQFGTNNANHPYIKVRAILYTVLRIYSLTAYNWARV